MSLKNKLHRLKSHINLPEKTTAKKNVQRNTNDIPYIEMWRDAGAVPYFASDDEYCFIREKRYPLHYQHGKYPFQQLLAAIEGWNDFSGVHPLSAKGFQPDDLFFFDTETTGLGGGVGNTIFILGYARLVDDEIVLRQHFLPEPGLEVPLYQSFLENVDYTTLVTYNGKAFDWPQVKTRHTLIREHVPKLPSFGHFDLYHASRRLWKNELESTKLVTVEKEILSIERENDIPGYLAPMIYFDYVDRKHPEGVLQVLSHNEKDILSLITLYTHLSFQIQQADPSQTSQQKVIIGKWFDYLKDHQSAIRTYKEAAINNNVEAKYQLAFHYKRQKEYEQAKKLWQEVVRDGSYTIQKGAYIELAKLMEHQFKNIPLAKKYTQLAIALHQQFRQERSRDRFMQAATKRLQRLVKKER